MSPPCDSGRLKITAPTLLLGMFSSQFDFWSRFVGSISYPVRYIIWSMVLYGKVITLSLGSLASTSPTRASAPVRTGFTASLTALSLLFSIFRGTSWLMSSFFALAMPLRASARSLSSSFPSLFLSNFLTIRSSREGLRLGPLALFLRAPSFSLACFSVSLPALTPSLIFLAASSVSLLFSLCLELVFLAAGLSLDFVYSVSFAMTTVMVGLGNTSAPKQQGCYNY